MKTRIRKGDMVYVISGDDVGMTGRVLKVNPAAETAIVEKVNMVTKHMKQRRTDRPAGLVSQEAPISLSKLALVNPKTNEPTRIRWEVREEGTKVRVSKKTGEPI